MRGRCINNEGLEELLTTNKYYELIPIDTMYGTVLSDKGMPVKIDVDRFEVYENSIKNEHIELASNEAVLIINYLIDLIGNQDSKEMGINEKKEYILNYIKNDK